MKKAEQPIKIINSVSELHRLLCLPPPKNTLITLIDHTGENPGHENKTHRLVLNFYHICIKRSFQGQMRYGRNYYDFDKGTMVFSAPNQVIAVDQGDEADDDGWSLLFHPDLIRNYPLGKSIKNYGFFAYEADEALHLSDEEEKLIESLVRNIEKEYQSRIDNFSADVIVSNLELLLNYCNRFYNRQFVTRKMSNNDLLSKFENNLSKHFDNHGRTGLPTVNSLAEELNVSASYLSDMLRTLTGRNTQQHIHDKLIAKAQDVLATTDLSVSEIAFQLGFEHRQSFNKLFKNKTKLSPLAFRRSFN
ncbi:helix-turn-helix domain-containing protein [Mucilaginibacter paludis]|uniref:Transcriptional regulator, AraC family n=1 Tax=Mucilaginibacter paludis DSM 18603 TaxID=714943 RepID=H1Y482_9SPHI|nr:helix-turn-helix transcriptional regulator [Mucilaginibacter paludis]EHQ24818.1 transcriptional regulator, AraC family [Mucilaginibacter paludis DSM 18603]